MAPTPEKKSLSNRTPAASLLVAVVAGALTFVGVGCNGSSEPNILPVENQTVSVGDTLEFDVDAQNANSLEANELPEGARFNTTSNTEGEFSWSPLISQTGEHEVEFVATGAGGRATKRVTIQVNGGCDGPEIVSSSRWIVDTSRNSLQRSIQIEENHCAKDLSWETSDLPDGMTVTPLVHRATVHWEPSESQWNSSQTQYQFDVTVTNDEGKSTTQTITIQLGGECPGVSKPSVSSTTPSAQRGPNDYPVTAQIAAESDSDIKDARLYWAPGEEPDPDAFVDTEMSRQSSSSDVWEGLVELEEDLDEGESQVISFRICAVNRDPRDEQNCSVQGCTDQKTFTAQMGTAGGLCKPCKRDGQCGGPTDRCVEYGPSKAYCGIDCSSTGSCPRGYTCKETVNGNKQCIRDNDCGGSGEYRPAEQGDLVVNEVLAHPTSDVTGEGTKSATGDQFVEIVSTASDIVDIGRYKLQKDSDTRFTFPAGTTVAPGEAVLVFGGGDPKNFDDFGTSLVFSARTDRADVGMLELRRDGDTIRLANRSDEVVTEFSYGDQSKEMSDAIANDGQAITRSPQVEGATWVKHTNAPGAGTRSWSPGHSSCGKEFPMSANGGCGGQHCLGRATDDDIEPNDESGKAVCVSGAPLKVEGHLHYVWTEPQAPGPDPEDFYELKLSKGDKISAGTKPGSSPDISNTKLQILDDNGNVLAENLHRHDVRNWYSKIDSFEAPSDGLYYVRVSVPQGKTELEGSYILRIEPLK